MNKTLAIAVVIIAAGSGLYLALPYIASPSIEIHEPYARITPKAIGVYMMIQNHGLGQDCLVGAEMINPISIKAEIHRTIISNGVAKMEPVGSICISGRSEVKLEPGGLHIMIMGNFTQDIKEITLVLHFQRSGDKVIKAPIKETETSHMH